jgi:hypothetical protein
MKRWLMFIAALPLFAHAAAERIISLGGDVTEIVYALEHSSSWSLKTVPAPGLPPRDRCRTSAIYAS